MTIKPAKAPLKTRVNHLKAQERDLTIEVAKEVIDSLCESVELLKSVGLPSFEQQLLGVVDSLQSQHTLPELRNYKKLTRS